MKNLSRNIVEYKMWKSNIWKRKIVSFTFKIWIIVVFQIIKYNNLRSTSQKQDWIKHNIIAMKICQHEIFKSDNRKDIPKNLVVRTGCLVLSPHTRRKPNFTEILILGDRIVKTNAQSKHSLWLNWNLKWNFQIQRSIEWEVAINLRCRSSRNSRWNEEITIKEC